MFPGGEEDPALPQPSAVTYLQDLVLEHGELVGVARGEVVADFGISLGQSHSLCLKVPAAEQKGGVSGCPWLFTEPIS